MVTRTGLIVLAVTLLLAGACSILNRKGPDVTCADLDNGARNACQEGIIATCSEGRVTFEVCDDGDACEANWQDPSRYRCDQSDPLPDLSAGGGSSGTGGSGGTGGYAGGSGGSWTVTSEPGFQMVGASVVADTNGDGIISPGETGRLEIEIVNTWQSEAPDVRGTLTTTSPSATLSDTTVLYFGDIASGSSGCGKNRDYYAGYCGFASGDTDYPALVLGTEVAAGTVIEFELALEDAYGNMYDLSFAYTVAAIDQAFVIRSTSIAGDTNGDGSVSPGETGRLEIEIENTGEGDALDVRGTLTTTTSSVTLSDAASLYFGDVTGGSSACGKNRDYYAGYCAFAASSSDYPAFTVAADTAVGTNIRFDLVLEDTHGNTFN